MHTRFGSRAGGAEDAEDADDEDAASDARATTREPGSRAARRRRRGRGEIARTAEADNGRRSRPRVRGGGDDRAARARGSAAARGARAPGASRAGAPERRERGPEPSRGRGGDDGTRASLFVLFASQRARRAESFVAPGGRGGRARAAPASLARFRSRTPRAHSSNRRLDAPRTRAPAAPSRRLRAPMGWWRRASSDAPPLPRAPPPPRLRLSPLARLLPRPPSPCSACPHRAPRSATPGGTAACSRGRCGASPAASASARCARRTRRSSTSRPRSRRSRATPPWSAPGSTSRAR